MPTMFSGLTGGGNKEAPSQMIAQQSGREQDLLDLIARSQPVVPSVDLTDLDKLVSAQALLDAYKSKAAQQELRPEVAAGEQLVDKELLAEAEAARAGRLPSGIQNALVKAGLAGAINTGSMPTVGSKGMAGAAEIFGSNSTKYLQDVISRLAGWTQANPAPAVGLSPEAAGSLRANQPFITADVRNNARSELLGSTLQSGSNLQSLIQGLTTLGLQKEEARKQRNNQLITSAISAYAGGGMGGGGGGGGGSAPIASGQTFNSRQAYV